MKKVVLVMILILTGFTINTCFVKANDYSYGVLLAGETTKKGGIDVTTDPRFKTDCGLFGSPQNPDDFAYYLQKAFDIIRFLGPILVLLMTIIDLVKVTASEKQDGELKKIGIKTLKRAIYAVILFALPTIITVVFNLVGLYGTCVS